MVDKLVFGKVKWFDVHKPTKEDVDKLVKSFNIHPLVAGDLINPSARSKADVFKNHIYLILHFPIYDHKESESDMFEVDFVIGKNFIITSHYKKQRILADLKKHFGEDVAKSEKDQVKTGGHLFYFILRSLYRSLETHLEKISYKLDDAEEKIFLDNPKDMVEYLAALNHNVLDFKHSLKRHGPILTSFNKVSSDLFGDKFQYYSHAISGEYEKIWNITEDNKEMVKDLQETNDSLLNTRSNEIMKNLTIMAFITFPLTLLASIFGMNTKFLPIVGMNNDFWIIMSIMIAGMALMLAWFRHKKWL